MAKKSGRKNLEILIEQVRDFIAAQGKGKFNYRQVAKGIGVKANRFEEVALVLEALAADGEIVEVTPGRYKKIERNNVVEGTFVRRSNGKNSVLTDDDGEMIFVAERNSMHALNGDKVKVAVAAKTSGNEPEGEVIEIIEKKDQTFIGRLQCERHYAYLITDSKYLATDIFIPKNKLKGAKNDDKVVVKITSWPDDAKNPVGEVVKILGKTGENETEIHAILAEYDLPYTYPQNVEKAASKIEAGITSAEIARRVDMRKVVTFTIDPHDAKDFDDALSIRKLKNGNYEIGVHIADVTHYVTPDSVIEKEAQKRATSVYLVDRVVPMLPEHLCNFVCSLRPNEEKLTFSVLFEINELGKVVKHKICRCVINSDRRFSYEEAQQVIETGKGDFKDEILTLNRLAQILRKERYEHGSVDFDRIEVRFNIDDKGRPVEVYFKESKEANKLIEEFMLLANKTVAAEIGKVKGKVKPKAFVYRVHDKPDQQKLEDLAHLAKAFGYKLRTTGSAKDINRSLNKLLVDIKGKGEENLLSTLALRCMAKAEYSTDNIGHYGLGFEYYTHFTSPIRRYPDMMVHRLLERYLDGGRSVNVNKLEEQCKHSSDMEQVAANAERSSIKFKQVEYLSERLGHVYEGIISGVTEWGLYVELIENKCEGLIPIRDLDDDYYDFDERNYMLVGRKKHNRFQLGDAVNVRVARTNIEKRQVDFSLVDDKMLRAKEDELGVKVSVREVLRNKSNQINPKKKRLQSKKSR
ncbi:MAG: ribonuclease R [Muribaculaceae bacterium]|nr:ribonuclease R [Muribaculaceae bacterium]